MNVLSIKYIILNMLNHINYIRLNICKYMKYIYHRVGYQ